MLRGMNFLVIIVGAVSVAGLMSPTPLPVVAAKSQPAVSHHGLKKGETLMGGNPVAPSFVPRIPKKRMNAWLSVKPIHPSYAYPAPNISKLPTRVRRSIPPSLASKLTAYYFPLGGGALLYIVAPNEMSSVAQVGEDGSYDVTLKGHGMEVDLFSTGGCQGCAVDAASILFPSARKQAVNYGGYQGPYMEDLPVNVVNWNSNVKLWGYKEANHRNLAGFALYRPLSSQTMGGYWSEVMVGSAQQVKQFAPWMFQNTLLQL